MAPIRAALLLAVSVLAMVAATTAHGGYGKCAKDGLDLKVCADVLGLAKVRVNVPRYEPCCSLLDGVVDLDAAVCLCASLNADVLGVKLHLPVDLRLILNNCGKVCPTDFQCPDH